MSAAKSSVRIPEPAEPAADAPGMTEVAPGGRPAANDEPAQADPLVIMTIGMAVFFSVAALLIAIG